MKQCSLRFLVQTHYKADTDTKVEGKVKARYSNAHEVLTLDCIYFTLEAVARIYYVLGFTAENTVKCLYPYELVRYYT